jgi:hypothetical protein
MGSREIFLKSVADLSVAVRIERAKECVNKLTEKAVEIVDLHANANLVSLSDRVSGRITNGKAYQAYSVVSHSLLSYEIIRLTAVWDSPGDNVVSIPTAIALIDDHCVTAELAKRVFENHSESSVSVLNPSGDPEIQRAIDKLIRDSRAEFANNRAALAREALNTSVDTCKLITEGIMHQIRNLRNLLSHSLTETRREANSGKIAKPAVADILELKTKSVDLIQDLHCWINGTDFDISGEYSRQADECADAFWNSLAPS